MTDGSGCKVDVVSESYGLEPPGGRHEGLDEYLLARWKGADGWSAVGYRTLADVFNRRLLRRVYEQHGRDVLDTRLESDYETLTGEDDLQRAELVEYLADAGIDADRVRRDMVSWGSIATHLTECLDAEKSVASSSTDWERRSIEIATDRAAAKAAEAVGSLASKHDLSRDVDVTVQVNLECPECRTRVPLDVALGREYVCDTHDRTSGPPSPDRDRDT